MLMQHIQCLKNRKLIKVTVDIPVQACQVYIKKMRVIPLSLRTWSAVQTMKQPLIVPSLL